MVADDWRVIVVRAWRDGAQIRVRLLVQNGGQRTWVVTGADEALKILGTLLLELDAPGETPPDTPR
jgi:hypothetical protein